MGKFIAACFNFISKSVVVIILAGGICLGGICFAVFASNSTPEINNFGTFIGEQAIDVFKDIPFSPLIFPLISKFELIRATLYPTYFNLFVDIAKTLAIAALFHLGSLLSLLIRTRTPVNIKLHNPKQPFQRFLHGLAHYAILLFLTICVSSLFNALGLSNGSVGGVVVVLLCAVSLIVCAFAISYQPESRGVAVAFRFLYVIVIDLLHFVLNVVIMTFAIAAYLLEFLYLSHGSRSIFAVCLILLTIFFAVMMHFVYLLCDKMSMEILFNARHHV